MVSAMLDEVTQALREHYEEARKRFEDLAHQVADGSAPPVDQIEDILLDADKSAEDLAAAVKSIELRREQQRQLQRRADLEAERQTVEAQLAAEQQRWEPLAAEHTRILQPILARRQEIDDALVQLRAPEKQLWESAPAELREQHAALGREAGILCGRQKAALDSLKHWTHAAEVLAEKAGAQPAHIERQGGVNVIIPDGMRPQVLQS